MNCICCGGDTRKFGSFKNRNGIVQRLQCLKCGKTFSNSQPLDGVRIESAKVAQVVQMLCEGVGIRATARLSGLCKDTVLNILASTGRKAGELLDSRVTNIEAKFVSVDEMFGFVGCLQQNTKKHDALRGDQYAFLAIEQTTKLIIHHCVGKRDRDNAAGIMQGLKDKTTGRFQLTSDGYMAYAGWTGSVRKVFGRHIDYGIEVKHFGQVTPGPRWHNPVKCIAVTRKSLIGSPDRSMMTTNHSERCNLSMRLFNRRFTRKTLGYSKTLENHKLAVALQVAYFNFCRTHSALKIKATETSKVVERTPAMAAGLTDHVWTVEELIGGK